MTLKTAYTELANVITGNAAIITWATAAGGTLTTLKGNREVERIDVRSLPALVLEMGALNSEIEVAGEAQEGLHDMKVGFVWHNGDEAAAFDQKHDLAELVIKAVMGNGRLNGAVLAAWVSSAEPDMGYHHPRHSVGFTVKALLRTTRT